MNYRTQLNLQKAIASNGFAVVTQVLSAESIESIFDALVKAQKSNFVKLKANAHPVKAIASVKPSHRRVLHIDIEYSAIALPGGLKWFNT